MLAVRETLDKINTLDDDSVAIVVNLVDYLSTRQRKSDVIDGLHHADSKTDNIHLLSEMIDTQSPDDEDFVSDLVIDNALRIIIHIIRQPAIFRTFENSIHMQFEAPDRSYLEFEVFEDRITCMLVPQRKYEEVIYPEVLLGDMRRINQIVGDFYDGTIGNNS